MPTSVHTKRSSARFVSLPLPLTVEIILRQIWEILSVVNSASFGDTSVTDSWKRRNIARPLDWTTSTATVFCSGSGCASKWYTFLNEQFIHDRHRIVQTVIVGIDMRFRNRVNFDSVYFIWHCISFIIKSDIVTWLCCLKLNYKCLCYLSYIWRRHEPISRQYYKHWSIILYWSEEFEFSLIAASNYPLKDCARMAVIAA